jgi:hypothetical protein
MEFKEYDVDHVLAEGDVSENKDLFAIGKLVAKHFDPDTTEFVILMAEVQYRFLEGADLRATRFTSTPPKVSEAIAFFRAYALGFSLDEAKWKLALKNAKNRTLSTGAPLFIDDVGNYHPDWENRPEDDESDVR